MVVEIGCGQVEGEGREDGRNEYEREQFISRCRYIENKTKTFQKRLFLRPPTLTLHPEPQHEHKTNPPTKINIKTFIFNINTRLQ